MAGHSKWANIQYRKGKQDAKRGKLFSRLIREITAAAKRGIPDPSGNPRLRAAMDEAAANNIPKDTIERAIKRGAGKEDGTELEEVRYEGYGPGGAAVMVDCMTDNRNRTAGEVRHAFTKCGGNLGMDGSVGFLFKKTGLIAFPAGTDEDVLTERALEAGAEDIVRNDDGSFDVLTAPDSLVDVKDSFAAAGLVPESAAVTMRAMSAHKLQGEAAESMIKLLEMLEDLDDVQKVYSNADFPDEVLAAMQ